MAKKFGSITGIHKVFNSVEDLLNSIFNLSGEYADTLDANSIIYFTADDIDVSIFSALQVISGVQYIWEHGRFFGLYAVATIGDQTILGNKTFSASVDINNLTVDTLTVINSATFKNRINGSITGDADTVDGKHADDFVLKEDHKLFETSLSDLQSRVSVIEIEATNVIRLEDEDINNIMNNKSIIEY